MISIPRTLAHTGALWVSVVIVAALNLAAAPAMFLLGCLAVVATLGVARAFGDRGDLAMTVAGAAGGALIGFLLPLGPISTLAPFLLASLGFYAGKNRQPVLG